VNINCKIPYSRIPPCGTHHLRWGASIFKSSTERSQWQIEIRRSSVHQVSSYDLVDGIHPIMF